LEHGAELRVCHAQHIHGEEITMCPGVEDVWTNFVCGRSVVVFQIFKTHISSKAKKRYRHSLWMNDVAMTGKILAQISVLPRNGRIAGSIDKNGITPFCRLRVPHRPQLDIEGCLQQRTPPILFLIRRVEADLRVHQF
jgi:hypothetical protein